MAPDERPAARPRGPPPRAARRLLAPVTAVFVTLSCRCCATGCASRRAAAPRTSPPWCSPASSPRCNSSA
ncbi:hypothetical protein NKH77_23195 [Streptomyces sp. M19]